MRAFAHHDRKGVIHSVVLFDAPDGVEAGVEPELGVLVTETDGVDLGDDAFDYDEFVREEFGTPAVKPAGLRTIWWVTGILLVIAFGAMYLLAS